MVSDQYLDDVPDDRTRLLIGDQVRQARELACMTSDDLARKLNLRASFIIAVEEGRGANHMEWAYERIHLRSIARLLDLDLDLPTGSDSSESAP